MCWIPSSRGDRGRPKQPGQQTAVLSNGHGCGQEDHARGMAQLLDTVTNIVEGQDGPECILNSFTFTIAST